MGKDPVLEVVEPEDADTVPVPGAEEEDALVDVRSLVVAVLLVPVAGVEEEDEDEEEEGGAANAGLMVPTFEFGTPRSSGICIPMETYSVLSH